MKKRLILSDSQWSFRIEGTGSPVVLLHGFGESGSIWDVQHEQLVPFARVVTPDLPGTGDSHPGPKTPISSLEMFATQLVALLDQEGISTCTIIGHSMGGYIALAFAEKFPHRTAALGLFHSTALKDSDLRRDARRKGVRLMQEYGTKAFLKEIIPGLYAETFRKNNPEIVSQHIDQSALWATPKTLAGHYQAMMDRPDRTSVLASFNGPVLMVLGAQDKTVALEETMPQAALLKDGHVHVLEAAAHMGMLEASEQTADILKKFITGLK